MGTAFEKNDRNGVDIRDLQIAFSSAMDTAKNIHTQTINGFFQVIESQKKEITDLRKKCVELEVVMNELKKEKQAEQPKE